MTAKKIIEPTETPSAGPDVFRLEAEENAAKLERMRLEHIAQERGVTVAALLAPSEQEVPTEEPSLRKKAVTGVLAAVEHVKESIRESNKHAHRR